MTQIWVSTVYAVALFVELGESNKFFRDFAKEQLAIVGFLIIGLILVTAVLCIYKPVPLDQMRITCCEVWSGKWGEVCLLVCLLFFYISSYWFSPLSSVWVCESIFVLYALLFLFGEVLKYCKICWSACVVIRCHYWGAVLFVSETSWWWQHWKKKKKRRRYFGLDSIVVTELMLNSVVVVFFKAQYLAVTSGIATFSMLLNGTISHQYLWPVVFCILNCSGKAQLRSARYHSL